MLRAALVLGCLVALTSCANTPLTPTLDAQPTYVSVEALPGDSVIYVTRLPCAVCPTTWARVGSQTIYFGDVEADPPHPRLRAIPATGRGSITSPIAAGTRVELLPLVTPPPYPGID